MLARQLAKAGNEYRTLRRQILLHVLGKTPQTGEIDRFKKR